MQNLTIGVVVYPHKHAVRERLRRHWKIALTHEHDRFRERTMMADDFDDLLLAVRRDQAQLDLATLEKIEMIRAVAAVEEHVALAKVLFVHVTGKLLEVLFRKAREQVVLPDKSVQSAAAVHAARV